MQEGFLANSLRGTDASGIASVNLNTNVIEHTKLPVPGYMFPSNRPALALMGRANNAKTITIGHTRSATTGIISQSNAHPFHVKATSGPKEIIGVHNGTLNGWTNKPNGKDYFVDSHWALAHIFNRGIDAFKDFDGGFCFVWWDNSNPKFLNIALNDQRPMHIVNTEKGGMAFASEAGMLAWLLERNNIDMVGDVMKLSPDFWYSIPVDKPAEFSKVSLPLYEKPVAANARKPVDILPTGTFERVDAFLKRVAGDGKPKGMLVSLEEIEAGKTLAMRGCTGVFSPIWDDPETGEVQGDLVIDGDSAGKYDAIIRCHGNVPDYTMQTAWKVNVLGVRDKGPKEPLVMVCSRPILSVISETTH